MQNRRSFLKTLGLGLVGVSLPLSFIPKTSPIPTSTLGEYSILDEKLVALAEMLGTRAGETVKEIWLSAFDAEVSV